MGNTNMRLLLKGVLQKMSIWFEDTWPNTTKDMCLSEEVVPPGRYRWGRSGSGLRAGSTRDLPQGILGRCFLPGWSSGRGSTSTPTRRLFRYTKKSLTVRYKVSSVLCRPDFLMIIFLILSASLLTLFSMKSKV